MRGMNRTQRRELQNMKKDKILERLPGYFVQCYDEGVRDSFMAILLKLHDEFGFGNERIQRLLKASEPWMQALINGKEGIDVEGIKQTLIDEGVTCIKDTDL